MESRILNKLSNSNQKKKLSEMLESLDEIDDIQNIFINCDFLKKI